MPLTIIIEEHRAFKKGLKSLEKIVPRQRWSSIIKMIEDVRTNPDIGVSMTGTLKQFSVYKVVSENGRPEYRVLYQKLTDKKAKTITIHFVFIGSREDATRLYNSSKKILTKIFYSKP